MSITDYYQKHYKSFPQNFWTLYIVFYSSVIANTTPKSENNLKNMLFECNGREHSFYVSYFSQTPVLGEVPGATHGLFSEEML